MQMTTKSNTISTYVRICMECKKKLTVNVPLNNVAILLMLICIFGAFFVWFSCFVRRFVLLLNVLLNLFLFVIFFVPLKTFIC